MEIFECEKFQKSASSMHFEDNIFKKQHPCNIYMQMYKAHFRILIFERVLGSLKVSEINNFQLAIIMVANS